MSLFSSFYFAQKFLYFSERNHVYPASIAMTKMKELALYDRVWSYGNAYIEKNHWFPYKIFSPEGYEAVYPLWYGQLLNAIVQKGNITNQVPRTDADLKPAPETDALDSDPYRLRLMELLGVKYILEGKFGNDKEVIATEKKFPPSLFTRAWENETWRIWQYKHALPRTYIVSDYGVIKNKQAIANKIFAQDFKAQQAVILEEIPSFQPVYEVGPRQAIITSYEPEEVIIETQTDSPALLVLSDTYFPGWKAYVKGNETKIYRANYAFRAIEVPAGNATVRFSYEPSSVRWGTWISIFGFFMWGTMTFYLWKHIKKG